MNRIPWPFLEDWREKQASCWFKTMYISLKDYNLLDTPSLTRPQLTKRASFISIYNGNWTEWSEIWSEIIRVISKLNERVVRVRFEITSMISDQKFNCHFIRSILKPHNFWRKKNNKKVLALLVAKLSAQWLFAFSFLKFYYHLNRTLKSDWLLCFTVPFSLAEKKMRFEAQKWCDSWINRTTESQSDCKENQWFQNGFNKDRNHLMCFRNFRKTLSFSKSRLISKWIVVFLTVFYVHLCSNLQISSYVNI